MEHLRASEIDTLSQKRVSRRWLVLVTALYLALHIGYSRVSPPQDGPDEPQHTQYVRSLALYHQLPRFDGMRNDYDARPMVLHTALHGPVYYGILAPFYLALRHVSEPFALQALRHLTGLLGIILIWLMYAACARLFRSEAIALGAAAATALHPLTIYLGSTISNEMLAAVWVALVFYFLARALAEDVSHRPWLGAGVAIALGLLTKYTAIVALFAALGVLLVEWRRRRVGFTPAALRVGALVLPTLLLGGWWFARNLAQHGELFVLQYDQPLFKGGMMQALLLPEESLPAVGMVLLECFRTYVGPLWLFREWPQFFVWLLPLALLLFLPPALGGVRARFASDRSLVSLNEQIFLAAAAVALLANLAGVLNTCLFKQWLMWIFGGRFLLVSLPGTMLLCVVGVAGWARHRERRCLPIAAFCALLALQNVWLLPAVWRFYHR